MVVQREERCIFVARLEEVLPLLRERFGVARIGIFGSAARGEDRPESDVDILVEFAPGETTFRNFMELALYLEGFFGRRVDLVTEGGSTGTSGRMSNGRSSGVRRDALVLLHEVAFSLPPLSNLFFRRRPTLWR